MAERRDALEQRASAHPRHDDVGDEQIDWRAMRAGDVERLFAVRRLQHGVAGVAQRFADERAEPLIVFGDEHGFRSARGQRRQFCVGGRHLDCFAFRQPRQIDAERRAAADLGLDVDHAAGVGHDLVHDREAEPRAVSRFLRREERLEDPGRRCAIHPVTGVGHRQADVVVGHRGALHVVRRRSHRDVRELDLQRAAARHRVARVDHEVEQHLLDLPAIAANGRDLAVDLRDQPDVLAEHAPHHLLGRQDEVVEHQHARRHGLPAAEGEQLLGELGRAVDGRQDFHHLALLRILVFHPEGDELRVPAYGGQ